MKNTYKIILAGFCGLCMAVAVHAQTNAISTGYFTDGYINKTNLNPALISDRNYVTIPLLNATGGVFGSLAVNDLFVPSNGGLLTIFHPDVSVETAMQNIKMMNSINSSITDNIAAFGWWNLKGTVFNTIDIGIKVNQFSNIPGDVFALGKGGNSMSSGNRDYNLSNVGADVMAYTQFTFGQSYKLPANFRLGYKAKFMLGVADFNVQYDKFNASLQSDKWLISTNGYAKATGIYFNTDSNGIWNFKSPTYGSVDDLLLNTFKNLGFAFDVGATWDITDWAQVSASVQDLGVMFFRDTHYANSMLNGDIIYSQGGNVTSLKDLLSKLGDVSKFKTDPSVNYTNEMLPAIIRIGGQIRLPMYKKFSFGALYTQRFYKNYGAWEVRASANYDVLRWLGLSVSYAYGTYEHQLGALVTVHIEGFNFFLGTDNIPFSYSVQGIPVNTSTATVSVGIGIMFGKYMGRYPKELPTIEANAQ